MAKIILCGFTRAGKEILNELLLDYSKDDIFVFTVGNDKKNKDFLDFIKFSNVKFSTKKINNCLKIVKKERPQYLISIYYPYIISDQILKQVKFRVMNLHPSLLPKYKGCFSAPWVIINNEKYTGITYHYMFDKVDQGRIILQKKLRISKNDTAFSLYHKLITLGINNFPQAFKKLKNRCRGIKQKEVKSYYRRGVPYEGYINLEWPRGMINRFIRAMYFPPFKGAVLKYKNKEIEFQSVNEFKKFIKDIRLTELILGTGKKVIQPEEKSMWRISRKSLVTNQEIKKGQIITEKMLTLKRPGMGFKWEDRKQIIGKTAKKNIKKDNLILLDDIE